MSESPYEGTFRERIARNRRNSLLLIAGFLAFVTVFGYIIGFAWIGDPTGALFGLVLAFAVGTISGLVTSFAGGRDPEHASVAVTKGLLEKLERDELQGVIAHEMAHVGNFDIRYAMLVGILVGTTVLISDFFLRGLWFGGGRRREAGGQAQIIMIVVALVLAVLAPIFARLLQLSISRQREYLADATAVKFTRNPKVLPDGVMAARLTLDQLV